MSMRFTAAVLLAAILMTPAVAQKLPLSMKRSVELAVEPDGAVRLELALEAIRQSEAQKRQALAALLPNLDAYMQYDERVVNLRAFGVGFSPFIASFIPPKVGPFNVFDARARVTETLSVASYRRYQAAKESVQATRDASDGTRDDVAAQVARAYLGALRAQARLEAARANVQLAEELLTLANNQKDAGTGTGIDVTRAQVQLANEQQQILLVENEVRRAQLELLRAMDLRLDTEIELTDRLQYHPVEVAGAAQSVETAVQYRSDWKAQQLQERSAGLNYSATKWERLPSVSGFGDYGSLGNGIEGSFPTRLFGVKLTIPIWDGGRIDARRAEAASVLRQARIRTADLRSRIELEIRLSQDALRSADEQVKVAGGGLELADSELAQAKRRFEAGVTSSIEVTDAQNRLARARDNQIAALYQYEAARLDLGAALGRIREFIP